MSREKNNNQPETSPVDDASQAHALCPECQTGILHLKYLTYFTWLDQELVTVPNFPAWVCDVCGRREYDTRAINWLNILLSPETGQRRRPARRKPGTHSTQRPQP